MRGHPIPARRKPIPHDVWEKMDALAYRILTIRFDWKKPITTKRAQAYLNEFLYPYEKEIFGCMYLKKNRRPYSVQNIWYGRKNSFSVDPETIIAEVLGHQASAVITYHSFPHEVLEPSRAEQAVILLLSDTLRAINVTLLDHIVLCAGGTLSFVEQGLFSRAV